MISMSCNHWCWPCHLAEAVFARFLQHTVTFFPPFSMVWYLEGSHYHSPHVRDASSRSPPWGWSIYTNYSEFFTGDLSLLVNLLNHLFISLRTHGYSSADKFLSFLLALQFFDFWEQFAFYCPECLVLDNPAWDGGGDLSFHANPEVSITIMVHSCAVTALDDFFLVLGGACRMRTISL